jgi:uncharacterized protein (TIGR02118 family)
VALYWQLRRNLQWGTKEEEIMIKATALFGHPEDPDAFEEYYANTHTALVHKIPNLQRFDQGKVIATPDGSEPPYYRFGDLWFENMDQMQSSLGSPEGQEVTQDIQNFATGGVTFLISEVTSEA